MSRSFELTPLSNMVGAYDGLNERVLDDASSALKFNLPNSMINNISLLAEATGVSKTEVAKDAFTKYFQQSHTWNNKRYFVEKKEKVDLSLLDQATDSTRVYVMWCPHADSIRETEYLYVCARLLDVQENTVTINPQFFTNQPFDEALIVKSEVKTPTFINFDEKVYNQFQPFPYLHNLKYEIEKKYLWDIVGWEISMDNIFKILLISIVTEVAKVINDQIEKSC